MPSFLPCILSPTHGHRLLSHTQAHTLSITHSLHLRSLPRSPPTLKPSLSVALYTYFLNIHGGGRILDLYRRISGKEGTLFLPLDVEISPQELLSIIQVSLPC